MTKILYILLICLLEIALVPEVHAGKNYKKNHRTEAKIEGKRQVRYPPNRDNVIIFDVDNTDGSYKGDNSKVSYAPDYFDLSKFETNGKTHTLKIKAAPSDQLIELPKNITTYSANIKNKSYLFIDFAKNPQGKFLKSNHKKYDFLIPQNVALKLNSNGEGDGFIIVAPEELASIASIPQETYNITEIPLEAVVAGANDTIMFFVKIGNKYGFGKVDKFFKVQERGNAFTVTLKLIMF